MKKLTILLVLLLAGTACAQENTLDVYGAIDRWTTGEFTLDEVINFLFFMGERCGVDSECFFSRVSYTCPDMWNFYQRIRSTRVALAEACAEGLDPESFTDSRMNSLVEFRHINTVGLHVHDLDDHVENYIAELQEEIGEGC